MMMNTIMKFIYTLLLMSLILKPSQQHRNVAEDIEQQRQDELQPEEVEVEQQFNLLTKANFGELSRPQLYQLNTSELALIKNPKASNLTGRNSSSGGEDFFCAASQSYVIYLLTMILYCLVCIVGLFGNTLVIYVVLRFSKMQTVTNIYILNLAIADECFLIGIPFLLYTMRSGYWAFGEYACKAYMVSTSITQFTSSIFLLIMSADRYIAVCHPITSPRYRTPMVSKMVSGIAWLTSVLLMLPVILFANTVPNDEHPTCNIEWPESQNSQSGTTFILYSLVLGFAAPLTFILIFYCMVIRKLHSVGPKNKSKEKKRSHRKVTRLVLTVITVYILCWLPYWISQVALITSSDHCMSRLEIAIFLLVSCLGYSNSAMNPVLYAFLSDNFKKSFMKACTCSNQKNINGQIQMENSFLPRFNKSRATDQMLPSKKGKQKRSILSKAGRQRIISSTMTTTTTTATTNCTNATFMEDNSSYAPMGHQTDLLAPPSIMGPSASSFDSGIGHNPMSLSGAVSSSVADNISVCNGIVMDKPPVLCTDL